MNHDQMKGWQPPLPQQVSQDKFKEPPKSVPDVGMGQKKVQTSEPQAY